MKKLLLALLLALAPWSARAHDHLEIGPAPGDPQRLAVAGQTSQLATWFPLGEAPSNYLPVFPGGAFARELSFSAFDENSSPPAGGAFIRVELLAVSGPAGATFSFWEAGATSAAWTRPTGWTATSADQPSLAASQDGTGYGHIHGRVFTTDRAGIFDVTFRAVDTTGHFTASAPFTVRFTALAPPPLAIAKVEGDIRLTFTSRPGLSYDVQSTTTLESDDWDIIGDPLDGDGGTLEFTDPIADRPRVFYRLVEYQ